MNNPTKKNRFTVIEEDAQLSETPHEAGLTPLERARQRHGKPFGRVWPTGEGPRVFNPEAVARLRAANERRRGSLAERAMQYVIGKLPR